MNLHDENTHRCMHSLTHTHAHTHVHTHTHLISGQDLEGGDDLVCCVRVGRFPGHEVNEGLEGDGAAAVGVYYAHDASELAVALATRNNRLTQERRRFELRHVDADRTCVKHRDLHDIDRAAEER